VGPVTTALLLNHTVDAAGTQYAQTRSESVLAGFRSSV
jgi:methylenetetrahydrofolate dehydrogenase (NADP+)/methenyltetrahydrofolate cyclohydrolase